MTNPTPDSTVHLGGKIISDRVVAQLLQEMRTGRWAGATACPPSWTWPTSWGSAAPSSGTL